MGKYNFDEIVPRRGTNSYKWDGASDPDVLPLWVADMDFRTAPAVVEALRRRVEHGIFGYTRVPDEYYQAVIRWFGRRHGWEIQRDSIIYTSGVVPAISATVKALTSPGDKVLLQTPVYNCFFSSIRNNGCVVESCPLKISGNSYVIDFEGFETHVADPSVKVFLLCNPHNPAGRVWTLEELRRLGEICLRHGVTVISDEIHCELVYPGHKHIPFASISPEFRDHSVTFISPSKAFNIAGLQIANIVTPDETMRRRIDKAININEVCDVNPFGVLATIAAYEEGEEWLEELLVYLRGNYEFMLEYCRRNLPDFPVMELEGTYLVWMDCRAAGIGAASSAVASAFSSASSSAVCAGLPLTSVQFEDALIEKAGLWLNAGSMYGPEGEGFMRWNIACPRARLAAALKSFSDFVCI